MSNLILDVVIPCYNDEETLERAVQSALQQAEVRHIIVVDDGSTDSSLLLMKQLAQQNVRVKVLSMPVNGGVARARNWGGYAK